MANDEVNLNRTKRMKRTFSVVPNAGGQKSLRGERGGPGHSLRLELEQRCAKRKPLIMHYGWRGEPEKPRQQASPCAHVCGVHRCIIALEPSRKENDRQRGHTPRPSTCQARSLSLLPNISSTPPTGTLHTQKHHPAAHFLPRRKKKTWTRQ